MFSSKLQYFQLNVTIIEARNLTISNEETLALVSIGKKRRLVLSKTKKTQNPYFNETFTFTFREHLNVFISRRLRLSVNKIKCKKLIGLCDIELAIIWNQLGRQVHHKWVVLVDPSDPLLCTKGYLCCDISIVEEGALPSAPYVETDGELTNNLLVPTGVHHTRQNALFTVNVYRADSVVFRRVTCRNKSVVECKKLFVKIHFATKTMTTMTVKGPQPVWNQSLTFMEPVPSLFQNITVELWDKNLMAVVGSTCLSFSDLCQLMGLDAPTLGPTFLFLYQKNNDNPPQTWLSGRILLSITCERVDRSNAIKRFPKQKIAPLNEIIFEPYTSYTLFLAVFQCIFFDKKFFKKCQIGLHFGHEVESSGIQLDISKKDEITINLGNKPYFYWKCVTVVPSAVAFSQWPATDYRERKSNRIRSLFFPIEEHIKNYKKLCRTDEKLPLIVSILRAIIKASEEILNFSTYPYGTKLDHSKNTVLNNILIRAKSEAEHYLKANVYPFEKIIIEAQYLTSSILDLIESNHYGTFPDFQVTITKVPKMKNKASVSLKTEDYLYSKNKLECGSSCGRAQSLFFEDYIGNEIGALDVFLWFGKEEDITNGITLLTGHAPFDQDNIQDILMSEEHLFELRVHVYQGQLNPGLDDSGLADPFVRVIAFGQCQETVVKAQTLDPIWNETLIFPQVRLFGTSTVIQRQSYGVLFEVLDYDGKDAVELVGRACYRPKVTLLQDFYAPARLTKQTIRRFREDTGVITLAMELIEKTLEHSESAVILPAKVFSIPQEIQPHLHLCQLQVIFWGLRNYKNTSCWNKLIGVIECNGVRCESPLVKSENCVNFELEKQHIDIYLPQEEEYAPPLSMCVFNVTCSNRSYQGGSLIGNINTFRIRVKDIDENNEPIPIKIDKEIGLIIEPADNPDWWSKYFASKVRQRDSRLISIYKQELETQPEFESFQDFLYTFHITRGKTNVKNARLQQEHVGSIKCSIKLGSNSSFIPTEYFRNDKLDITVRVYIVSAYNLNSWRIDGYCDSYIALSLGTIKVSDRKNCVYKENNPIFGKCYELKGTLPMTHTLCVKVMNHDVCLTDHLIGETYIDIENRFYTKFRAACGLADTYEMGGYCQWRDVMSPVEILEQVCKMNGNPPPVFIESGIRIGQYMVARDPGEENNSLAHKILKNLRRLPPFQFQLVPEHVETRSLYNPIKPRIPQGRLEMWVDIFPGQGLLPPIVDITARQPEQMELRVIVWNTAQVLASDVDFLTSEESIDIYVVGWLTSSKASQKTDTHYRSLTGDGVFNWRFIFPFLYSPSDFKMIICNTTEISQRNEKIPPKLELQLWDEDLLSDDYIGSLTLDLCNMPQGALSAKKCNLEMFNANQARISLFKAKKVRGWWPFRTRGQEKEGIAGKIDMELEILSKDQADLRPVGLKRDPPEALQPPKRPGTSSFIFWDYNPLSLVTKIAFGNIGKKLGLVAGVVAMVMFVVSGWLALPGILLKQWLGN